MTDVKKLIFLAILVSQSLVLYIIESNIPNPLIMVSPSAKIGLSNIITLTAIVLFGFKDALIILFTRIILSSLFASSISSFLYSISGGILSIVIMNILFKFKNKLNLSLIGISIVGAIFHNIGQLIVSAIIIQNTAIFIYLPVTMIICIPTGFFIGLSSEYLTSIMAKHIKK